MISISTCIVVYNVQHFLVMIPGKLHSNFNAVLTPIFSCLNCMYPWSLALATTKRKPNLQILNLATPGVQRTPLCIEKSHTKASASSMYFRRITLTLFCMTGGLKYGWCQHNDACNVIYLPSFAKPLLECMTLAETVIGISVRWLFSICQANFGFFH